MRHLALVPALALALSGCMSMQPVAAPTAFLQRNNPEVLRLIQPDGELVVLRNVQLRADTIAGFNLIENAPGSYALGQFTRVEAKQLDRRRTTFALIGGAAALGAIVWGLTHSGDAENLQCNNYVVGQHCTTPTPRPTPLLKLRVP